MIDYEKQLEKKLRQLFDNIGDESLVIANRGSLKASLHGGLDRLLHEIRGAPAASDEGPLLCECGHSKAEHGPSGSLRTACWAGGGRDCQCSAFTPAKHQPTSIPVARLVEVLAAFRKSPVLREAMDDIAQDLQLPGTRPLVAQVDTRKECTCTGHCKGAAGLGAGWKCALSAPKEPEGPRPPVRVLCDKSPLCMEDKDHPRPCAPPQVTSC